MALAPGTRLGPYDILSPLGAGGFGEVYKARDTRLDRTVAIKILPSADPELKARFEREAKAIAALTHPHICTLYDVGHQDGTDYLVLELLDGQTLKHHIGGRPLPLDELLDLACQIADALDAAHASGIIHRDIKPTNILVTRRGQVKILDFGLAKLALNRTAGAASESGVTMNADITDRGATVGTIAYMSPEQARGLELDSRTDLFSFGVVLYEMATGTPAFPGSTSAVIFEGILSKTPMPLARVNPDLPEDLERIVGKALEKDRQLRYQHAADMLSDLKRLRRDTSNAAAPGREATPLAAHVPTVARLAPRRRLAWLLAAAIVLAASGGITVWLHGRANLASASGDKPSVAVLYFENNSGNPQLDWLRTGLTDMLVTDLSQSPDVEVLGTDRLVQILGSMHRLDDRQISFDTVQQVAKRAGVKSVLLGSYVKAGDTIRINVKLQDAASGRIVTAERVDAINESSLLSTVDDLTRRIRARFAPGGNNNPVRGLLNPPAAVAENRLPLSIDRDLKDVSTSSIEAYRYYVEGIDLHNRGLEIDSVPLLEKAIKVDPSFAMAMAKLAVIEGNNGHPEKRAEYANRAMEHRDRLTLRERYYIEAVYYTDHADQLDKAIEAYKQLIDLYPNHASARHNLALLYSRMGRDDEAIPLYEELRRRGMAFPITYTNLAAIYTTEAQYEKAYAVLQEYVQANPDVPRAYNGLGAVFAAWGRYDDAIAAYDRAIALEPNNPTPLSNKHDIYIAQERWSDAAAVDEKLSQLADPQWKVQALLNQAREQLYKGRLTEALRLMESALTTAGPRDSALTAAVRLAIAEVLVEKHEPSAALVFAQRAFDAGGAGSGRFTGLGAVIRIHVLLGHETEVQKLSAEFTRRVNLLPGGSASRFSVPQTILHTQTGIVARLRHDETTAIQELKHAESATAPGLPNTQLYFELGSAYLAAGNDPEAAARFDRIVKSGTRRANRPLEFVRSLFFLGQISERNGDRAKAAEYYKRFVQYWSDGDIDRERVADARNRIR